MDQILDLSSDSPSAVLIWGRPENRADEDFLYRMEIALHPDGGTALEGDFDDEWTAVWRREPAELWRLCEQRQAFVELLPRGRFVIRVTDHPLSPEDESRVVKRWRGQVAGDGVVVETIGSSGYLPDVISLGTNPNVEILHLGPPEGTPLAQGTYWSATHPAVVVRRVPDAEPGDAEFRGIPNLIRFDPSGMAAPAVSTSRAKVHRIDGETVLLKLYVSENVLSGYAAAPVIPGLHAGEDVTVRLLDKSGGRWRAEIVAE